MARDLRLLRAMPYAKPRIARRTRRLWSPRLTYAQRLLHTVVGWILAAWMMLCAQVTPAHAQTNDWPVALPRRAPPASLQLDEQAPTTPQANSFAGWSALAYAIALPLGVGSFVAGNIVADEVSSAHLDVVVLATAGLIAAAVMLPPSVQLMHGQVWGAVRTFTGTVLSVAIGLVAMVAIALSTLCIDIEDPESDSGPSCRADPAVPVLAIAAGVSPYIGWAITDVLLWSHE